MPDRNTVTCTVAVPGTNGAINENVSERTGLPTAMPLLSSTARVRRYSSAATSPEAIESPRPVPPKRRLVQFVLENPEPLLYHNEPIYRDGKLVGLTSSSSVSSKSAASSSSIS